MQKKQLKHDIIVIGASLGGVEALRYVFSQLPPSLPASVFAVLHLQAESPSKLDKVLAIKGAIPVKFAEQDEAITQGTVYLAPPDQHLLLKNGRIALSRGPRENRSRPAVDPLFRSAAVDYGARVIGVVLTGMLDDGTAGMMAVKLCGGVSIVQDPDDAIAGDMPANVLSQVEVDHCVKLSDMPGLLRQLVTLPVRPAGVPEYLRKEVELSQGQGSRIMEQNILGQLTPFTCPDCGGSISEIDEGKLLRFRCHEGHAYGPESFSDAHTDKLEYSLWSAVRMLEEQGSMLRRLAKRAAQAETQQTKYEQRAQEMHAHAARIKEFLLNPPF